MYGQYAMQPPMGPFMPWWPQPPQNQPQADYDPVSYITKSIAQLEALKKAFKEEPKKDDKKKADTTVIQMMLLMILMSPITGPIVYTFFQWGNTLVHR